MPHFRAIFVHRIRIDPIAIAIMVYREIRFQMLRYECHPSLHGIVILFQSPEVTVEIMLYLRQDYYIAWPDDAFVVSDQ